MTIAIDTLSLGATVRCVTSRELRRVLRSYGCVELRQKGSHLMIRCGKCQTVVPVHPGEDIAPGTLHSIERALDPCLGKGWSKR
jgi:predicted RNA binding protein YcfA (HicA-like mRNA interferase family)